MFGTRGTSNRKFSGMRPLSSSVRVPSVADAEVPQTGRPATLEEVVIGHLAAGRRRDAATAAPVEEAAA